MVQAVTSRRCGPVSPGNQPSPTISSFKRPCRGRSVRILQGRCVAPRSVGFRNGVSVVSLLIVSPNQVPTRRPCAHAQEAAVCFLAAGMLYRTTWGMNQDTYLAQLQFSKSGLHVLARLVDEYSNSAPPIPAAIPEADAWTPFYVIRNSDCDLSYGELMLRTTHGDSRATLPERLSYQPQLSRTLEPGMVLPCFRVMQREGAKPNCAIVIVAGGRM